MKIGIAMKSLLLLVAIAGVALAADPFYPKALGEGEASSVTSDTVKFSFKCARTPTHNDDGAVQGSLRAVIVSRKGITRTLTMASVEEANFLYNRCTFVGKGTLVLDYGKGKPLRYEGVVRATVVDNASDRPAHPAPGTISLSFSSKDIKTPQVAFQGKLTAGRITVTHLPMQVPKRFEASPPKVGRGGADGGA